MDLGLKLISDASMEREKQTESGREKQTQKKKKREQCSKLPFFFLQLVIYITNAVDGGQTRGLKQLVCI